MKRGGHFDEYGLFVYDLPPEELEVRRLELAARLYGPRSQGMDRLAHLLAGVDRPGKMTVAERHERELQHKARYRQRERERYAAERAGLAVPPRRRPRPQPRTAEECRAANEAYREATRARKREHRRRKRAELRAAREARRALAATTPVAAPRSFFAGARPGDEFYRSETAAE